MKPVLSLVLLLTVVSNAVLAMREPFLVNLWNKFKKSHCKHDFFYKNDVLNNYLEIDNNNYERQ